MSFPAQMSFVRDSSCSSVTKMFGDHWTRSSLRASSFWPRLYKGTQLREGEEVEAQVPEAGVEEDGGAGEK
jgi:hypothetical protein